MEYQDELKLTMGKPLAALTNAAEEIEKIRKRQNIKLG